MKIRLLCCVSVLFVFLAACSGLSVYHPTEEDETRRAQVEQRRAELAEAGWRTFPRLDPTLVEPLLQADWTFWDPLSPWLFTMSTPVYGIQTGVSSMRDVYGLSLVLDSDMNEEGGTTAGILISLIGGPFSDDGPDASSSKKTLYGMTMSLADVSPYSVYGLEAALLSASKRTTGIRFAVLDFLFFDVREVRGISISPYNAQISVGASGAIGLWNENSCGSCGQIGIFNRHWELNDKENPPDAKTPILQIGAVCDNEGDSSPGIQVAGLFNFSGSSGCQIGGLLFNGSFADCIQIGGLVNLIASKDEKNKVNAQQSDFRKNRRFSFQSSLLNAAESCYCLQLGMLNGSYSHCLQIGMVNRRAPETSHSDQPDENKNNFISFQLGLWNNNKNERELAPRSIQFGLANRSEGKALQLGLLNFNTSEDAFLPFCPFFNYN